jgi:hypothetical protein
MMSRKRISRVINPEPEIKYQLPILRGVVIGKSIVVHCPFCDRHHVHGWDPKDTARDIYYPGAHCDFKNQAFAGGRGVLYGVSPFPKASLKVLMERQEETEWRAYLKARKVRRNSDKAKKEESE